MADTGAPWNIPFVEPTDLVRDYPAADEAQALAVAAGLSAAGGLVAVKSAIFTGVQSASTAAGAALDITDLSITHEVADASNRLIITATVGVSASSEDRGDTAMAVFDGSAYIGVGDADGPRTRVLAGGRTNSSADDNASQKLSGTFVHTPGTGSKTYTLRLINSLSATRTLFVNRTSNDLNDPLGVRGISSLVIQEVKV